MKAHSEEIMQLALKKYRVTEDGRIFHSNLNRELKLSISSRGYKFFNLYSKGRNRMKIRVSRMVALAYIPNPDNLPCVHHVDGDRRNDNRENLEWVSEKYNVKDGWNNGRIHWRDVLKNKNTGEEK